MDYVQQEQINQVDQKNQKEKVGNGVNNSYSLYLFLLWVVCQYSASVVMDVVSHETYELIYFFSQDFSAIFLSSAWYFSIEYRCKSSKGISVAAIAISISIMLANLLIEIGFIDPSYSYGLAIAFVLISATYLFFVLYILDKTSSS